MDTENVPVNNIDHDAGDEKATDNINGHDSSLGKSSNSMKKPSPPADVSKRRGSKKITRQNSRENAQLNGSLKSFVAPQRRWKNSRRSRNGNGRGLPKKGGGGGKGVWGLPGSELLEEEAEIDQNDPNYDPEADANVEFKEVVAEPTPEDFFKQIEPIILEYFDHCDTNEVTISLDEIIIGSLRPYVITYAVQISLDHKEQQRELTSVLISDLYGRVVTSRDIAKGKTIILQDILVAD